MTLPVICVVFVALASLTSLVIGDPTTVLKLTSVKLTNNQNDYYDPWTIDVIDTKRNPQITVVSPVKQDLPPNLMATISVSMAGGPPFDYTISVCEAWSDPVIGSSFLKFGVPKKTFPRECPIGPGEWTVLKWDPPVDKIPPGIPDGDFSGFATVGLEGEPFIRVEFEGHLSHSIPGFGI